MCEHLHMCVPAYIQRSEDNLGGKASLLILFEQGGSIAPCFVRQASCPPNLCFPSPAGHAGIADMQAS